jgi:PAS domain S-box-containing protein
MEKNNPKFDLLELALETGKGSNPRESWGIFLKKFGELTACEKLSVWRYNPNDDLFYFFTSTGEPVKIQSKLNPLKNWNKAFSVHCIEKKHLPSDYQKTFSKMRETLVLIRLDGYGLLSLEDPGKAWKNAGLDEEIYRICQRQTEAALQLEQCEKLLVRNRKKRRIIQQLRDWRGVYAELFENINDAVLVTGPDGVITNANRSARTLLGFPKSKLHQASLRDFIPDYSVPKFDEILLDAERSGTATNQECDFKCADGNTIHCLVNCSLGIGPDGKKGYNISLHDITRRKKAEALLEQILHTQEQIINNLPVGLLVTNMEGEVTSVNPPFFEIFQNCNSEEDLKNFRYEDHFLNPEKEVERVLELNSKMKVVTNDVLFLKDGKVVSRDFVPIIYGGKPISKLWTFKDITDAYNAHVAIKASEQRYRGVIENLSLGILEWNPEKKVVSVYPSFLKISEADPVKILGRKASDLFVAKVDLFDEQEQAVAAEVMLNIPGVKNKWMLISTVPVYESGQHLRGYLSVLYDITERKKMEEELREAKQRALDDRDYERYFLANMSHEIRTPLNAIAGMTHLLKNTTLSSTQKQYVDSLESSTDTLLHLLNDILDISKMEAGQMDLDSREFNLNALCHELVEAHRARIKGEPVQLMLQFDKRIDHAVIGDPVRLRQILGNLLSNACKFTKEGAIVLELNLIENKWESYHIKFAVHDTGIGIPAEKQKHIFERFKQADAATGNEFGGTGLGLSIVKQLVELHGGFIEVESEVGEGSTFSFMIDLKKSPTKAAELEVAENQKDKVGKELQNGKFLVVDDNPTNLKLMARLFETWGCKYQLAMSGNEAIVKTREERFDLVLMDLRMPGMDGCETTRRMRRDALNQNRKTPIIALSAAILPDDRKQALLAGMDDFMPKPFSPPQLLECLHRHLKFRLKPANALTIGAPQVAEHVRPGKKEQCDVPSLTYLMKFSNGDKSFVRDVLTTFLKDAPDAINKLEKFLSEGNSLEAANILHRFKPNLETLGLQNLRNDAIFLENELKDTSSTDPETLMRMCKPFMDRLMQALSSLRRSLKEL